MKTLELSFKGSDMRVKHLRLKYVNTELTADDVTAVMNQMAKAKLFVKDGVNLYADLLRADVVETTKTTLMAVDTAPTA